MKLIILIDLAFLAIAAWALSSNLGSGDTFWTIVDFLLVAVWSYCLVRDMETLRSMENEKDPH